MGEGSRSRRSRGAGRRRREKGTAPTCGRRPTASCRRRRCRRTPSGSRTSSCTRRRPCTCGRGRRRAEREAEDSFERHYCKPARHGDDVTTCFKHQLARDGVSWPLFCSASIAVFELARLQIALRASDWDHGRSGGQLSRAGGRTSWRVRGRSTLEMHASLVCFCILVQLRVKPRPTVLI